MYYVRVSTERPVCEGVNSLTYNISKLGTTKMCNNDWMEKQILKYSNNGCYSAIKRKTTKDRKQYIPGYPTCMWNSTPGQTNQYWHKVFEWLPIKWKWVEFSGKHQSGRNFMGKWKCSILRFSWCSPENMHL